MRGRQTSRAGPHGLWLLLLATACGTADQGLGADLGETDETGETDAPLRPSWHQDIAPIVHARCVGCHDTGGVAPFALDSYAKAAPWASLMAESVLAQRMPPWGAHETEECHPSYAWANDMRLSDADQEAISAWAAAGAPKGDPDQAATLPEPPDQGLVDANEIFEIPAPILLPDKVDSYACVSLDPGLAQDVWVTGAQLLPDNAEVVHHVLIMLDASGASGELAGPDGRYPCGELDLGTMLGSYFPGSVATQLPDDVGVPFPVGARIVLNFHYHPSLAGADVDQSSLALRWTVDPPSHEALLSSIGNATSVAQGLLPGPNDPEGEPVFLVPAGAREHTETMQITVPEWLPEARLFMLGPHMHDVATDIRVTLERAGELSCLIQDPRWDPDWQRVYTVAGDLAEFPTLVPGDRLTVRCTYDNSLDNPSVVQALAHYGLDAPINVHMGSAALDEMCMFVYGLAIPR